MIYGFVRQSGGQVRIYSEVGKGTTMSVYLPRFLGTLEHIEVVPAKVNVDQGDGEIILVVDDEPTLRMLINDVLKEAGYQTLLAQDGVSALRFLQSETRIDLLVTDVGLPGGMNGRQVADAARETRPGLKALFITGYAENAAIGNGHLQTGMQLMTKPFEMNTLVNRVRDMLEH
jgi:CheY-like chemotaxis protein